jgi:hypothetical protein
MSTHNLRRKSKSSEHLEVEIQFTGADFFMFVDGVKIAKRGHPNTPQAKTWISLEPGWRVHESPDYENFVIEYDGVRLH